MNEKCSGGIRKIRNLLRSIRWHRPTYYLTKQLARRSRLWSSGRITGSVDDSKLNLKGRNKHHVCCSLSGKDANKNIKICNRLRHESLSRMKNKTLRKAHLIWLKYESLLHQIFNDACTMFQGITHEWCVHVHCTSYTQQHGSVSNIVIIIVTFKLYYDKNAEMCDMIWWGV